MDIGDELDFNFLKSKLIGEAEGKEIKDGVIKQVDYPILQAMDNLTLLPCGPDLKGNCIISGKERVVFNPGYPGLNVRVADEGTSEDAIILFKAIQKIDPEAKIIKDKRYDPGYLSLNIGPKR